jgi:UrcA family protein
MSPLNCNRGAFTRLGAAPLMTALLCSAAFMTTAALGAQPAHVNVSYVKSDLVNPDAAESLYKRIEAAARTVCQEPSRPELWRQAVYKHCFEKAVDDAVGKVDAIALTAVHRHRMQRSAAG